MTREEKAAAAAYHDKHAAICQNCAYFVQHFIYRPTGYINGTFIPCAVGHCTEPRCKPRSWWDSCQYFKRSEEHAEIEDAAGPAGDI